MSDFKETLSKHYENKDLTLNQYRVLVGLVEHGDEDGAKKGLNKLLKRLRKIKARA